LPFFFLGAGADCNIRMGADGLMMDRGTDVDPRCRSLGPCPIEQIRDRDVQSISKVTCDVIASASPEQERRAEIYKANAEWAAGCGEDRMGETGAIGGCMRNRLGFEGMDIPARPLATMTFVTGEGRQMSLPEYGMIS